MQTLDQFTFHATLAEAAGPVVVFFTAAACASCRYWKQVLSAYAAEPDAAAIYAVDAGADPALAREFEVFHLPALFLFVNGDYHRPLHCAASVAALRAAIAEALTLPAEEAP